MKGHGIENLLQENWLKAGVNALYVAPKTGIVLHKDTCEGDGQLNVYTGAGKGVGEFRFHLKSWRLAVQFYRAIYMKKKPQICVPEGRGVF